MEAKIARRAFIKLIREGKKRFCRICIGVGETWRGRQSCFPSLKSLMRTHILKLLVSETFKLIYEKWIGSSLKKGLRSDCSVQRQNAFVLNLVS